LSQLLLLFHSRFLLSILKCESALVHLVYALDRGELIWRCIVAVGKLLLLLDQSFRRELEKRLIADLPTEAIIIGRLMLS